MPIQYLINEDGTIPAGADLAALAAAGVPLVVPTPLPSLVFGERAVEGDPVQDGEGVWRQVWTVEAVEIAPAPMPELLRHQWVWLQYHPTLEPIFASLMATLKAGSPINYAALMGHRARETSNFAPTMALVASFEPFLAPGTDVSEDVIRPLWLEAAGF